MPCVGRMTPTCRPEGAEGTDTLSAGSATYVPDFLTA